MAKKLLTEPKTERDQRFFRIGYAEALRDIAVKAEFEGIDGVLQWIKDNGHMADQYFPQNINTSEARS